MTIQSDTTEKVWRLEKLWKPSHKVRRIDMALVREYYDMTNGGEFFTAGDAAKVRRSHFGLKHPTAEFIYFIETTRDGMRIVYAMGRAAMRMAYLGDEPRRAEIAPIAAPVFPSRYKALSYLAKDVFGCLTTDLV